MRTPILAVLAAASAAACVRSPDPLTFSEDAVSVHAVLHASATEARVWLHHVAPSGSVPVSGATISLASGGTVLPLQPVTPENAEGCLSPYLGTGPGTDVRGCFGGSLPGPAQAGSRWMMTATVPGYGVIEGATTIPALPLVTEPAGATRHVIRPPEPNRPAVIEIPVAWSAPGAARVDFALEQGIAYQGNQVVEGAFCSAWVDRPSTVHDRSSGSVTLRVHGVGCGGRGGAVDWDSAAMNLMVTAYDSAYAAYALHGSSTSRGRGGRGLKGAHGVFGSAASTPRRVMFVREVTHPPDSG
jgi:hypothetical protein